MNALERARELYFKTIEESPRLRATKRQDIAITVLCPQGDWAELVRDITKASPFMSGFAAADTASGPLAPITVTWNGYTVEFVFAMVDTLRAIVR